VLAVTNTQGSLIAREADAVLLTKAAPEVGVAATNTFLAQIAALYLLALELAGARGTCQAEELSEIGRNLRRSPEKVEEVIGLLEGGIIGGPSECPRGRGAPCSWGAAIRSRRLWRAR
jgi:glutamine---fructose-6-phosphate transaminase (isomerizing)